MEHVRFPSAIIRSADDFRRFREEHRDVLDERYRREQSLGVRDGLVRRCGTCGPCLVPTEFASATERGENLSDGRIVPLWRDQQLCGCHRRLNSRQRALLHLLLPRLGAADWFRAASLGSRDGVVDYLLERLKQVAVWPRQVPSAPAAFHMVFSSDQLHRAASLDKTLSQVARALTPGGVFIFTAPLDIERDVTRPIGSMHEIGWDIIDRMRSAAFEECAIHCVWSEEFGYLGTFNFVFEGFR